MAETRKLAAIPAADGQRFLDLFKLCVRKTGNVANKLGRQCSNMV